MAYREDPAKKRARDQLYRLTHAESIRASRLRRRDHIHETFVAWLAAHPGYERRWYASHRTEVLAKAKAKRDANPERYRAQMETYRKAIVMIKGESVNFNTLPPELVEVARLLKEWRKVIHTNSPRGETL